MAGRNKTLSLGVPSFLRISVQRDPSTFRGVPSDLNTLVDSVKQSLEEERQPTFYHDNLQKAHDSGGRKSVSFENRHYDSLPENEVVDPVEVRNHKSSGETTETDNFSIMSFVSDQIDTAEADPKDSPYSRDSDSSNNNNNCEGSSDRINHSIQCLIRDMEDYTLLLSELLETYSVMRRQTPDGIRQRFDLAFKEIQTMIQLQLQLNATIKSNQNDVCKIAEAFYNDEFFVYKRYTVLANYIQKDMKSYSTYFSENFSDLAAKIMVPSTRLNVYAQHLKGFLNYFCNDVQDSLQSAITFLDNLKSLANTEMTINVIQQCPIELRLVGLIKHVGDLHYEGDHLTRKLYYVILFENILIITENKYDFCTYKHHIRSFQLLEVSEQGDSQLTLKVCQNNQSDSKMHKFRAVTKKERNNWITYFQGWIEENRPSCRNTVINQDLISQISPQPNRFWPLSLWQISPQLKDSISCVRNHEHETLKVPLKRPNDPFEQFVKQEEDFITKLNVLLDPESMPPPPILGSVLRKMRRFHKGSFLPKLKKASENDDPTSLLDCIIGNLPNLPILYKEFIEVRAGLTLSMIDGVNLRLYITPFYQIAFYIDWLYEVSCIPKYHNKLRGQLNILLNCVEDARVTLLHIAISKCRMDYYQTGDIMFKGTLDSKAKLKNVKNNQQYYVILFEKAIMVTRPRIPYYEFIQVLWLDQITLGPQPECRLSFKIEERQHKKEVAYEFKAESEAQKNTWIREIVMLLNKQAHDIKKKVSCGRDATMRIRTINPPYNSDKS